MINYKHPNEYSALTNITLQYI